MKELLLIKTNGILDKIQVSKSRRPIKKAWNRINDIPGKLLCHEIIKENDKFVVKKTDTGEYILKNPKSAGKPRFIPINAQRIYVGIHHSVRTKIVHELKKWLQRQVIKNIGKKYHKIKDSIDSNLPCHLNVTFFKYINPKSNNKIADIDNFSYIYIKCFLDIIKENDGALGLIKDDSPQYIKGLCSQYIFVNKPQHECILFKLVKY